MSSPGTRSSLPARTGFKIEPGLPVFSSPCPTIRAFPVPYFPPTLRIIVLFPPKSLPLSHLAPQNFPSRL